MPSPKPNSIRRLRPLAAALLVLALLAAANSQEDLPVLERTGTISGQLDGEEREWSVLELDAPDGPQNTATYSPLMGEKGPHSYTIQGHTGEGFVEEALAISFATMAGPLSDCPCEVQGEVLFWTSEEMLKSFYHAENVPIRVEQAEPVGEDAYRLRGSVEAVLEFMEGIMAEPDADDTVEVRLEFEVERMSEQDLDL